MGTSEVITVRTFAHGGPEWLAAIAIRDEVLRKPLGLRLDPAALDGEASDLHLGAFTGETLVGCLVLSRSAPGVLRMRQVAVRPEWQGRGVGARLVREAEALARERGVRELVLHARETVIGFYERLGYRCEGERFVEVGIPHRLMRRALGDDDGRAGSAG